MFLPTAERKRMDGELGFWSVCCIFFLNGVAISFGNFRSSLLWGLVMIGLCFDPRSKSDEVLMLPSR